ncbi:something about silencing protein 10 [Engraulis encrasicolus]|uniref:something about silencing protein 10 n=1 Tax=Engraulis encrasicolus TaxID=184585 RepID=UPI002FCE7F73
MVRARRVVKKPKSQKAEQYDSDDPDGYRDMEAPDKRSARYLEDRVDEFHKAKISKLLAAGVEEESDQEEFSEEEEVMALQVPDEEEDDEDEEEGGEEGEEDMDSDLEGRNEDDLPDDMAWGQRKKIFYDTDLITTKGRSKEEVEEEEQEEEQEAKNIQKRLAANLSEEDYDIDLLQEFEVEKPVETEDQQQQVQHVTKDLNQLGHKQKMKLLKKESPELLQLIADFKAKLTELKDEVQPLVELVKDGTIPPGKAADYLLNKQQLYLHYCSNISFYLALKAKRIPAHNHPVIERLLAYRNLINELSTVDATLAPQMRLLLSGSKKPAAPRHTPDTHTPDQADEDEDGEESDSDLDEDAALEFYRGLEQRLKRKRTTPSAGTGAEEEEEGEGEDEGMPEDAKRGITYQMAKNKGLTPKRKKIDRNPRVKHREKFRRAQIRRKGQVQQVQKEMTRYSGEMSGIRAGVKKSVKLK